MNSTRRVSEMTASRAYLLGVAIAYGVTCTTVLAIEWLWGMPFFFKIALLFTAMFYWMSIDSGVRYVTIGRSGDKLCYQFQSSGTTDSPAQWSTARSIMYGNLRSTLFASVIITGGLGILIYVVLWALY